MTLPSLNSLWKDQFGIIGILVFRLNGHIHDPTLNDITQREYILFLCPTGALLNEISKFYEESYSKCGSNSAHNLFPHVTLTSFFKVRIGAL